MLSVLSSPEHLVSSPTYVPSSKQTQHRVVNELLPNTLIIIHLCLLDVSGHRPRIPVQYLRSENPSETPLAYYNPGPHRFRTRGRGVWKRGDVQHHRRITSKPSFFLSTDHLPTYISLRLPSTLRSISS